MDKTLEFVVLSTWIDKSSKQPKTSIAEVNSGTNKEGNAYQITSTDRTTTIDGTYKVGTIITGTTTFNTDFAKSDKFPKA